MAIEMVTCRECGEHGPADELIGGICDPCLEAQAYDDADSDGYGPLDSDPYDVDRLEPRADDRLRCCVCDADLGDASDPYRDPDCMECLKREWEQEAQAAEAYDQEQLARQWEPGGLYDRAPMTEKEMAQDSDDRNFIDLPF